LIEFKVITADATVMHPIVPFIVGRPIFSVGKNIAGERPERLAQ
jgi:hypothetical protein